MNYEIIRHNEVGQADHGWLKAKHYFSFASYYNPERMGFGKLRVINDDLIKPGMGFDTHPHRDMEIITIPLEGAVSHKDSKGHSGVISKGEVQVMSAGKGILHSEYNHSDSEPLKLFQIWIEPNKLRVEPRYDQKSFDFQNQQNQWTTLVSPISESSEPGLKIHQDAHIHASVIDKNIELAYQVKKPGNIIFLLVSEGDIEVNDERLTSRDAMAISDVQDLSIKALNKSELILIEVPLT